VVFAHHDERDILRQHRRGCGILGEDAFSKSLTTLFAASNFVRSDTFSDLLVIHGFSKYTDKDGECVTSCWGVNGSGLCVVKKSKKKEWETRLERLREQVEYWTNPENATEKTVEIVELFYDCD